MNIGGLIRTLILWALFLQSIGQLRPVIIWLAEHAAKEQQGFISLGELNRSLLGAGKSPNQHRNRPSQE